MRILLPQGSAAQRRSVVVVDVKILPGDIACGAGSRSKMVVPLLQGQTLLGVPDIDSPAPEHFGPPDRKGFGATVAVCD